MYTITFYSFKGGVGRTMALVNIAAQLAKMGRKVLVVDFDLEAPGLETFEQLRPPQPHPGLVEYVTEYMRSKRSPDARDYIYSVGTIGKKNGQLWVMPAGRRDRDYHLALSRLNWRKLYEDCDGFVFFEDLKAQWEQEYKPDYVLIDSRTGHSDVKGICTRQLPDAVVVLFFPNEQNLVGLKGVCREIRREGKEGLQKDIRLHFVMSNVPDLDDEEGVLKERLEAFHKEMEIPKLDAVIHRYESMMLLNQAIFVLDRPASRLAKEYQQLVEALIAENLADREGALRFLHEFAQRYLPKVAQSDVASEIERKLGMAEDPGPGPSFVRPTGLANFIERFRTVKPQFRHPIEQIAHNFLDDDEVLLQLAQCWILASDFQPALKTLNRTLAIKPNLPGALFQRAMCKNRLGDINGAASDLLQHLRDSNLQTHEILRALRELRTIAPDGVGDPVDISAIAKLPPRDKEAIIPEIIYYLLHARKWGEVIAWIERLQRTDKHYIYSWWWVFMLAMARWGETGSLPADLCKRVLQLAEGLEENQFLQKDSGERIWARHFSGTVDVDTDARGVEVKAVALWGLGKVSEASRMIDKAIEILPDYQDPDGLSFWHLRIVSLDQLIEDCQQLRRMIEGEPIRPPFLDSSLPHRGSEADDPRG